MKTSHTYPLEFFKSMVSTLDKRLTKGLVYYGRIINTKNGLRVYILSDDRQSRMTFDPRVFVIVDGEGNL